MVIQVLIFFLVFILSACVVQMPVPDVSTPEPLPSPSPIAAVKFEIPNYKPAWSEKVKSMLTPERFAQLDLAKADFAARFCPKYELLNDEHKALAWGYLIGAVTKYESSYNPETVYKESDGTLSEGLFQLTYGNRYCPKKKSEGDLRDPIVNIDCAMKLMASYIAQDKVVAGGGFVKYGAPSPKGLARYWAVIRVPDSKSQHKLKEIQALTMLSPGCE